MTRTITLFCALFILAVAGCTDMTAPTVGSNANDFTMNDQNNQPVTLSQFRGKVVLLDFWATWCGPCISSLPTVKSAWEKYRDRDFMIVGVSLDVDMNAWRKFIVDNDLDWTHIADGKGWSNAVGRQYGVDAIPQMILLDRNGTIIGEGYHISQLDSLITATLGN